MKTVLLILGSILAASSFFVAYLFYRQYQLNLSDLKVNSGTLAADPEFTRDEYDQYDTSMRLQLEGEQVQLVIPGKLLQRSDPSIRSLQKGDQISFYEKKKRLPGAMDGSRRLVLGLQKGDQSFLGPEQSLDYFKSPERFVGIITLLLVGLLLTIWVIRKISF